MEGGRVVRGRRRRRALRTPTARSGRSPGRAPRAAASCGFRGRPRARVGASSSSSARASSRPAPGRTRLYVAEALAGRAASIAYDFDGNALEAIRPARLGGVPLVPLEGTGSSSSSRRSSGRKAASSTTRVRRRRRPSWGRRARRTSRTSRSSRERASKDGTRVPMFLVQRKGTKRTRRTPSS